MLANAPNSKLTLLPYLVIHKYHMWPLAHSHAVDWARLDGLAIVFVEATRQQW